jgi:hypothetical protein
MDMSFVRSRMIRRAAWTATLLLGVALPGLAGAACTPPLDACADDFNCYQSPVTLGTSVFVPQTVTLADQFETATVRVQKQDQLCAPANKDGQGVIDEDIHLVAYRLRAQSPRHIKRGFIRVTNQLEEINVTTIKPDLLLVPSLKTHDQPGPPAPNPNDHNVDHFKCYRIRVTGGTPLPAQNRKVSVSDQFTEPAKIITLKKPRHLCLPVDKNGEGIKNAAAHLLCYRSSPAQGEPRHLRRVGLFVNNQLGPLRLNTRRESEFCIPTVKSLSPSGAFLEQNELDGCNSR